MSDSADALEGRIEAEGRGIAGRLSDRDRGRPEAHDHLGPEGRGGLGDPGWVSLRCSTPSPQGAAVTACPPHVGCWRPAGALYPFSATRFQVAICHPSSGTCLLYTSDAADERSSVDLGGRRIIKKKKKKKK